jgi:hypothetical protein
MIYVAGIIGFVGGFAVGQMVLFFLLRHKSNEELLRDKHLKLKYGLINWLFAVMGCYSLIEMYRFYFTP